MGLYYPMLPRLVWWEPEMTLRMLRTRQSCVLWRTSAPRTQKMTSSAMLVAWSPTRSRLRADDQRVEGLRGELGLLLDQRAERVEGGVVHLVDLVVEQEDGVGELGVGFDEGLQGLAHHGGGERRELGNVDGKIDVGEGAHLADADGDVDGLVAYALEVGVDADDREDEAQVDGHGLLHGEQVERHLVDLALEAVDRGLGAEDELADAEVARAVGLDGALDGLLGHAGHDEQILFQVVEALMKFNAHQPNLPVM